MPNDPENVQADFDELYAARERTDADDASDTVSQKDSPAAKNRLESTLVVDDMNVSRQELDLALTALLLQEGHLSERQLAKAATDWTIHGNDALSDHLLRKGLLSASTKQELEKQAVERLRQIKNESVSTSSSLPASQSPAFSTLNQIDASGRIAKLLGLSSLPTPNAGAESRCVHAQYELLRKIGQGGLGTVWLARDTNLRRHVAIKELSRPDAGAFGDRFRREAEITGRLEHPSIVPVYQFGDDVDSGKAFYAMWFLGKQTLQDAIAEYHERREVGDHDPMSLHHLLTAFVSVCQAIAYAHSRNIIHRDLKPENVALDNFGQVIVLDWGLAKIIGDAELFDNISDMPLSSSGDSQQTVAGQVLGTPMYMSPEQAAGRVDEIDERTDVYGLGAILFAILTGYAPHEASHQTVTSKSNVTELFTAIVSGPTPSAHALNPDVPPELEAVCSKAIAKRRYARYASASELAEDIQRWIAKEPVSSFEEPWSKRLRRWIVKHRQLSQVIAALMTVMLVVSMTLTITSHENRVAAQQAQYESLRTEGRELSIKLRAGAEELTKNVRFMAGLPPIQGIIDANNGTETDQQEVWQERLETIYRGLLHANPDYLTIAYASVAEVAQEIVRVERHRTDGGLVRVIPRSRLLQRERRPHLESVLQMKPGEVYMVNSALIHDDVTKKNSQSMVVTAATPIYDEKTGEVFGVVAVETNLEKTLRGLLTSTAKTAETVYVTDGSGKLLMVYSREHGFQQATSGRNENVEALIPEIGTFFSKAQLSDTYSDGERFYAIKVTLDPNSPDAVIGFVLTLGS